MLCLKVDLGKNLSWLKRIFPKLSEIIINSALIMFLSCLFRQKLIDIKSKYVQVSKEKNDNTSNEFECLYHRKAKLKPIKIYATNFL